MNEISTQVKKLNIFQKARLNIAQRRKKMSFNQYEKSPEYVKNDREVINNLVNHNNLEIEELTQLPHDGWSLPTKYKNSLSFEELMQLSPKVVAISKEIVQKFSLKEQAEFIRRGYTNPYSFSTEEKIKILNEDIVNQKNYDKFQDFKIEYYGGEKEFLDYLKENKLYDSIIPKIFLHTSNDAKKEILENNPELLSQLPEEDQIKYYTGKSSLFSFMTPSLQLKYINEEKNNDKIKEASLDTKRLFVEQNPKNIQMLSQEEQYQLINENHKLFQYMDKEMKIQYQLDNIEKLNSKALTDLVLYSGKMGALGKLSSGDYVLHGMTASEEISGIDSYSSEQVQRLQKLSVNQIASLIKIDVNYILPYLTKMQLDPYREIMDKEFSEQEKIDSQKRCESVFKELFGSEMLEKYKSSIQLIYDMQVDKQKVMEARLGDKMNYGSVNEEELRVFLQQGEIPLEEFKLLFNEKIISQNSPELIHQYLQEKAEGKKATKKFQEIITNAYGEKARAILESRPNLNVHAINSLEVFDEKILGEYGNAFTHDCISYNLRDFSAFLNVTKNLEKSKDFKIYYEALSEIYGKNVETMQKAMSEFHSVEALFANARDVELTDKQYSNLISVICSRKNPNQITSLEELQNYHKTVNQKVQNQIESFQIEQDDLKELICNEVFGIDFNSHSDYGKDLKFISSLYDIQLESTRDGVYTEEEQNMLKVIDFLAHEKDITKLKEFAQECIKINEEGMQVPVILQSALRKTVENQTEILNQSLTKIDDLKRKAIENGNTKEGEVYFEEVDGLEYYHLNGIDFSVLGTDTGNFSKEDTVSYEGQAGNNAICCRLLSNKTGNTAINGKQLFFDIAPNMIIAAKNTDAKTQHVSKRVKNRGLIDNKVTNILELNSYQNEVAQNRRYQDHEKITNENHGGRVIPDAYGVYPNLKLSEEEISFCKKYKIPVFVLHSEKYKTQNREESYKNADEKNQEGSER